jgi:protein involved in polysaccharide export with SLBB domain
MRWHDSTLRQAPRDRIRSLLQAGLVSLIALWPFPATAQVLNAGDAAEAVIHELSPVVTTTPLTPAYLDQVVDPGVYLIGPGDRLAINTWGEQPQSFTVTVTPEATLIIPTIGEVSTAGMTLTALKNDVLKRLRRLYPGTTASVTLTEVRRFRVSVSGAVGNPGLHVVTANTRVSEVIKRTGLGPQARRRGIRLMRRGEILHVDLDRFERLGDRSGNPYLAEGDIVVVPTVDPFWGRVSIDGAVLATGSFDYLAGDRLGDLIDLAYGLTANADSSRVELWRFRQGTDDTARLVSWPPGSVYADWISELLQPDDRIIIRARTDYRPKRSVAISGEVVRPGRYVFTGDSFLLATLVDSAGGFTRHADLPNARITRNQTTFTQTARESRIGQIPQEIRTQAENDWMLADALAPPGRVVTDFERLFVERDSTFNTALIDGDHVFVPRFTASVNVIGRVVRPGLVAHQLDAPLSYYLGRAGGYAWQADKGKMFLIKGGTGAAVKRKQIRAISAGDTIIIPTKRDRSFWKSVRETMIVMSSLATVYLVIDQATQ